MEKPWFDRLENDQTIVAFPLHTSVKRRARGQGGGYALEAVGGHLAHSSSREIRVGYILQCLYGLP